MNDTKSLAHTNGCIIPSVSSICFLGEERREDEENRYRKCILQVSLADL